MNSKRDTLFPVDVFVTLFFLAIFLRRLFLFPSSSLSESDSSEPVSPSLASSSLCSAFVDRSGQITGTKRLTTDMASSRGFPYGIAVVAWVRSHFLDRPLINFEVA